MLDAQTAKQLLEQAKAAAEKAYAPYSHFPVGAALLMADGQVMTGVNVENASYGLTICAERTALVKAASAGYHRKEEFAAIAVWATQRPHGSVTPCGACRQFLQEFFMAEKPIIMAHPETGEPYQMTMVEILPGGFQLPVG